MMLVAGLDCGDLLARRATAAEGGRLGGIDSGSAGLDGPAGRRGCGRDAGGWAGLCELLARRATMSF